MVVEIQSWKKTEQKSTIFFFFKFLLHFLVHRGKYNNPNKTQNRSVKLI